MNTMLEVDETNKKNEALEVGKGGDKDAVARDSIQ